MKKAGKKRGVVGRIFKGLLMVLLIAAVVFHRPLISIVRSIIGEAIVESGDKGLTYSDVSLSKEQMIEDLDALYKYACGDSLVREQAEKYFKLDYDEVYSSYRSRIENCKDEYEFCALMTAFMAKLPGAHNILYTPASNMDVCNNFPMGTELAFHGIRQANYSYWTEFEDRMWSYTQKCVVASRYGTDYVILDHDCGNGMIEGIVKGRILSLNGMPVPEALKTIDTIHHLGYDAENDCLRVTQIFFNDSLGEKYEAEIEMPDGRLVKHDLYVSPEYSLAMQFRTNRYPEHDKKDNDAGSASTDRSGEKSYFIESDADRKLVYVYAPSCYGSEKEAVLEDISKAAESVDAENIIIDLKNNSGGDSDFITKGLCPAVFDKDGGCNNTAIYPRNKTTRAFYDNPLYGLADVSMKLEKDRVVTYEDFTVQGQAGKKYNIYVLVSGRTCSSGDIAAGIMADYEGVTLIGENTEGEGFTGAPLTGYLPQSKFAFAYTSSVSEARPDNNVVGTKPDIYCVNGWESYLKQIELNEQGIREKEGEYAYRLQADDTLQKAISLLSE